MTGAAFSGFIITNFSAPLFSHTHQWYVVDTIMCVVESIGRLEECTEFPPLKYYKVKRRVDKIWKYAVRVVQQLGGYRKFVPVLVADGTKKKTPRDIFHKRSGIKS